jgi:hypothetical protein
VQQKLEVVAHGNQQQHQQQHQHSSEDQRVPQVGHAEQSDLAAVHSAEQHELHKDLAVLQATTQVATTAKPPSSLQHAGCNAADAAAGEASARWPVPLAAWGVQQLCAANQSRPPCSLGC